MFEDITLVWLILRHYWLVISLIRFEYGLVNIINVNTGHVNTTYWLRHEGIGDNTPRVRHVLLPDEMSHGDIVYTLMAWSCQHGCH